MEIDRQFFDEMINRFNNNNIKIDRIWIRLKNWKNS